jgi:diguanylate cyclase (GGDEF)-like protein
MVLATRYALIAVSNATRGACFKRLVADALLLDVVLVRDGDAALHEIIERGAPGVLIVDPSLPRVDGFTVIRSIRREAPDVRTRIIVVSAHESLRTAASELATALEIATVLPLEADASALEEALLAMFDGPPNAGQMPAAATLATQEPIVEAEEVIDRAAMDARRRFRATASAGYLRQGNDEQLLFHLTTSTERPKIAASDLDPDLLRQVADGSEPIVIPDMESHAVFSRFAGPGRPSVRALAAVPVPTSSSNTRAALCILGAEPLELTAIDIDAFVAVGRRAGEALDRELTDARDAGGLDAKEVEDVEALQHLAATDPLTGVANRRGGEKHIANEISRARREKRPLSCVLVDLDRFKLVNDTYGHQAGDQLLRDVSALLRRTVRAYDILVRWGGDEFLIVLPGVDLDSARLLAERIRHAVGSLDTHGIGPITISAGASSFEKDYDFMATLKVADRRLYQAKAAGRNCAV